MHWQVLLGAPRRELLCQGGRDCRGCPATSQALQADPWHLGLRLACSLLSAFLPTVQICLLRLLYFLILSIIIWKWFYFVKWAILCNLWQCNGKKRNIPCIKCSCPPFWSVLREWYLGKRMSHFKTLFSDTFDSGFYLSKLQDEKSPHFTWATPKHSQFTWVTPKASPHYLGNLFHHILGGGPLGGKDFFASERQMHLGAPLPLCNSKDLWGNDARTWTKGRDFGVRKPQDDSALSSWLPDLIGGTRRWDADEGGWGFSFVSGNVAVTFRLWHCWGLCPKVPVMDFSHYHFRSGLRGGRSSYSSREERNMRRKEFVLD